MLLLVQRLVDTEHLTIAEQLKLVQDLWDEIAARPERVPLTDAQRAELDHRLDEHAAAPEGVRDWKDIKAGFAK